MKHPSRIEITLYDYREVGYFRHVDRIQITRIRVESDEYATPVYGFETQQPPLTRAATA